MEKNKNKADLKMWGAVFIGTLILCLCLLVLTTFYPSKDSIAQERDAPMQEERSDDTLTGNSIQDATFQVLSQSDEVQKLTYANQEYTAFIFDANKHEISFFEKPIAAENSIAILREKLQTTGKDLTFATNAGIFKKDGQPEGLFIKEGKILAPLNLNEGEGNFYLKPNGVFLFSKNNKIQIIEATTFDTSETQTQYATQSGPLLLQQGIFHPMIRKNSKNLRIRNGVGVLDSTRAVFLISTQAVNFYDFASVFKDHFGCDNALYLDGVISEMYLPQAGLVDTDQQFSGIIAVVKDSLSNQ